MADKIINHLASKNDHQDNLDGLILGLYESEIQVLSQKVTETLSNLISKGIIKEVINSNGERFFKLDKDLSEINKLSTD